MGFLKYVLQAGVARIVEGMFQTSFYEKDYRLLELFSGFKKREGLAPTAYPVACSRGICFLMVQATLSLSIDAKKNKETRLNNSFLPEYMDFLTVKNLVMHSENTGAFEVSGRNEKINAKIVGKTSSIKLNVQFN